MWFKPCRHAAQVLSRPHLLLVTLLLVNAAAMEALPIFLDRLVSPVAAIILSVTAVLFFGAQHLRLPTFRTIVGSWTVHPLLSSTANHPRDIRIPGASILICSLIHVQ